MKVKDETEKEKSIVEELKIPLIEVVKVIKKRRIYAKTTLENLFYVCKYIKNTGFDHLSCITCIDYRTHFTLVYNLWSTIWKVLVTLEVDVDYEKTVPSVCELWRSANWHEREIYDMFGIKFDGHPDLRRILLPENTLYYPLRKSFPYPFGSERK